MLLAKLLVGQGKIEETMRVVQKGIVQSQRESFFIANLYTVKGEIHAALAAQLEVASDPASKSQALDEKHAKKVCPDTQPVPATCTDVCSLAE